ncbi:hypothetical protein [Umezawaea sp. NPDC059074]|uniref:hypothetical protein n=1 Tax=Umezawaea sp. NPDC059074 TaxID=3346716 RepID=UPI00369E54C6
MNEVDRAEQRRQATERLTEVLARSVGTAEHPSRMAIATATATGVLTWLRLHPHALGQGPRAVEQLVVETARLATDAAVQRGYNELAKSLGDSMAIAIEGFAGPPPFRTAADAAAQAPHHAPAPSRQAGFGTAPGPSPSHQAGFGPTPGPGVDPATHAGGFGPSPRHRTSPSQHTGVEQATYGTGPVYGGAGLVGDDSQAAFDGTIQAPLDPPDEAPAAAPFAPTPPPPARGGRAPRPPVDDDDDAYFADPFGTGGSRR